MGCGDSKIEATQNESFNNAATEENSISEWKQKITEAEAAQLFEKDGTLPPNSNRGQLELRALLSEPISQPIIGNYAKKHNGLNYFLCWIDIQEYKSIESPTYRLSKGLLLFNKYIEIGSILDIHLHDDERIVIQTTIQLQKTDDIAIPSQMFNEVQRMCFDNIYHSIFIPFKRTDDYKAMTKLLKESYNYVRTDDFEYIKKLGEGGFGFVIQVLKKSTQQYYAMKIQSKKGLLSCFPEDPWRADSERRALAISQHPFIINLEYAFQTDSLAIMVLGLGISGDLRHALRASITKTLSHERVRFYAAEMVSALCHLHDMGLIYRDLKPNNILLNSDGHIQLVDLGAVADTDGYVLETNENPEQFDVLPVFETSLQPIIAKSRNGMSPPKTYDPQNEGNEEVPETDKIYIKSDVKNIQKEKEKDSQLKNGESYGESHNLLIKKRAFTIIGTYGYMAPEMVILLSQEPHEKIGYTHMVE